MNSVPSGLHPDPKREMSAITRPVAGEYEEKKNVYLIKELILLFTEKIKACHSINKYTH